MSAALHFVAGLLLIHAAWLYAYFWGTAIRGIPKHDEPTREEALLDLCFSSISGLAMGIIASFFIGLVGGFVWFSPILALIVPITVASKRGDSPFARPFWQRRWSLLRSAATGGAIVVWAIAVVRAVPAIIPDIGSDATVTYSTMAFDWAQSHSITVDQWLRTPWYPANWPLFETWWYVFRVGDFVEFIDPFAALLTLLVTYGFIVAAYSRRSRSVPLTVHAIATIAASIYVFTPTFFHWEAIPMIDSPAVLFFTAATIAGILAITAYSRRALVDLVFCAACFIGIKISYPAFLPLFLAFLVAVHWRGSTSKRVLAASAAALIVLASCWYVRDAILAGDPFAPILNIQLHGADPKFSQSDLLAQETDLDFDKSPSALLGLPGQAFFTPQLRAYRDWGSPLLITLIWLPAAYLCYALLRRRFSNPEAILVACCVVYAYAYWILTASLLRYSELFLPLLAAFTALALIDAYRTRFNSVLLVASMAALALPSPSSILYYQSIWHDEYEHIGEYYHGRYDWLVPRAPVNAQAEYVAQIIHSAHREDLRVYTSGLNGLLNLSFREKNIQVMGDVFGPERIGDFAQSLIDGNLADWLCRFHVGAMIFDTGFYKSEPLFSVLPLELKKLGWREKTFLDSPYAGYTVFLSPLLPELHGPGLPKLPELKATPKCSNSM